MSKNPGVQHLKDLLDRVKTEMVFERAVVIDKNHHLFGEVLSCVNLEERVYLPGIVRYWRYGYDSGARGLAKGELSVIYGTSGQPIEMKALKICKTDKAAKRFSERLKKVIAFK